MTREEHYDEAERLIAIVMDGDHPMPIADGAALMAVAQVHATLATVEEGVAG